MASSTASSSTEPLRRELVCRDWNMEKHTSVLEDELMENAPGQSVTAGSTPAVTAGTVNAPIWLQRAYDKINNDLQSMVTVNQKLLSERQDPNHVAPGIVDAYHTLLKQQNALFEQQTEDLQTARRVDYVQFEAASTQFAEETRMALEYVSKSAMDRANAVGKETLLNLNNLAVHNTKQFEKVEQWARLEEQARGRLETMVEEEKARNKAELESLKRDMVAWRDQAEKMDATRREAIKERIRFRATAYKLENEALSLGEEVRTALEKGKSLMAAELRSVQKLLKKTVKTAKSASTRGEPEKETRPLPPQPSGSQEGEAPEETDAPEELETSEAGLERARRKRVVL